MGIQTWKKLILTLVAIESIKRKYDIYVGTWLKMIDCLGLIEKETEMF